MQAQVIWSKLLELSQTEKLWDAQLFSVKLNKSTTSMADVEDEMLEEAIPEPDTEIFELIQAGSDVGAFLSQSLKDKVAALSLRTLRPYDYLAEGKTSVMFIDLEEHNELFQDLIKRLDEGDYEKTKDIEEIAQAKLFMVKHDLEIDGQKVLCVHGRKIFPRRISKRIKDDHFPTVGLYFEAGELKASKESYFEFDEDIDFLLVDNKVFIFNKFYFEQATQFTSKMFEQTDEAFKEIADEVFAEAEGMLLDMLTENPKRLRRKVSKIKKNEEAFYKLPNFMERFKSASDEERWGFVFESDEDGALKLRFPYTDENKIDALFTILNDGRLYSKLTGRTYETQQKREISRNEQ